MNLKHRHIISMGLLLCGLLGFASCDNESLRPSEEEDNSVFLTFHADVAGGSTRAEDVTPADEKINQLLIVIVSEEPASTEEGTKWVVEYNRLIESASTGVSLIGGHTFKVKAGCKKRIYLIANCKGLKDADGNPLDFTDEAFAATESEGKAKADDYVFALPSNLDNGIPMTAMHEVNIPSRKELQKDSYELGTLHVVRAATKFSFTFTNAVQSIPKSIAIKKIALDKIADKAYLMPHVNKNSDNKYWVANTDRQTAVAIDASWIDWMVREAEKTKEDNNINQYQWLTDYEVPEGMQHTRFTHEWENGFPVTTESATTLYLPESQNRINGNNPLKLQEYKLTLTTSEVYTKEGNSQFTEERKYTATLPQLASLFRNTHVKVNVRFKDYELDCAVDVEPYWEVVLDPIFGL